MEVGDAAAWFAAGIAIIAAFIAMSNANSAKTQAGAALKQAAEAEKARVAAEESAAEARKANEFMREKDARDQADRDSTAVAEASTVRRTFADMGGMSLTVKNHGTKPVYDLELESVEVMRSPEFTWRLRPSSGVRKSTWETVAASSSRPFYIDFIDQSGEAHRAPGHDYRFTISFTDANGQRWRRVDDGVPVRITSERGPYLTPHKSRRSPPLEGGDLRFRLLRVLDDRKQNGMPGVIDDLSQELGLDDDDIQEALRWLKESGYIDAMSGSDRVAVVNRLTAAGHDALERSGW